MNLHDITNIINSFVWGKWGIYTLLVVGIYSSVRLDFFHVKHSPLCIKKTLGACTKAKKLETDALSPFQTLCTSLAATIGVGNITGVSAAIFIGGPGAVFWMWVAAFFGMMTKYSEIVLGIYFRRKNFQGKWCGGAMYYLRDGVGSIKGMKHVGKFLAATFAFFTVLTSFGMGCIGQVNKIVINMVSAFPLGIGVGELNYSLTWGILLFASALIITAGGLKRTAGFSEKIVPLMVLGFIFGSLCVILKNYTRIIPAFKLVFSDAFSGKAASGGLLGVIFSNVCTQGFKRGIFSNEAGLGSSVLVHASTSVNEPCEQGMWGIIEVFVDTILVCTATALVILTSGTYSHGSDATMVARAFSLTFGGVGEDFIALMILVFAFTSVIAWNQYGSVAWEYMFGTSCTFIYRAIHLLLIIPASVISSDFAWDLSDAFNGLMMLPNLVGIILLMKTVKNVTANYIDRIVRKKKILPSVSFFSDIQRRKD